MSYIEQSAIEFMPIGKLWDRYVLWHGVHVGKVQKGTKHGFWFNNDLGEDLHAFSLKEIKKAIEEQYKEL